MNSVERDLMPEHGAGATGKKITSLESLCLISFQVKRWLGLLLHSSLQCGSRKSPSFGMEGEAPEVVENNTELYLSQVKSEEV